MRRLTAISLAAVCLASAGCGGSEGATSPTVKATITGAGSTLAAAAYEQWGINLLLAAGIQLQYTAAGSASGLTRFLADSIDFGATDSPLSAAQIAHSAHGTVLHVPTALIAAAVSYNLPGIADGLRLDGPTLAAIYLGRIGRWNDRAIAALNPGVRLPPLAILPVHRSDAGATTRSFTAFLTATSTTWRRRVGTGTGVRWPTGPGAAGNVAAATAVARTAGAVGYVEQPYALSHDSTDAELRNAAGKYVPPSIPATVAAAIDANVPPDLRFAVDAPISPAAYPIVTPTFALVYEDLCQAGLSLTAAKAVATFLDYGLNGGQAVLEQLGYSPLPSAVLSLARGAAGSLKCNAKPL